jgi:hypothetical protein
LLLLASWSAPGATRSWAVLFYLLALALNYPHYMATVYRAYHTRTEFEKYRIFTVHVTALLVVMGAASHVWAPLASWIFTLYVTWSPWHYTGQNFGLVMMFARRNGVPPTDRERRALHLGSSRRTRSCSSRSTPGRRAIRFERAHPGAASAARQAQGLRRRGPCPLPCRAGALTRERFDL